MTGTRETSTVAVKTQNRISLKFESYHPFVLRLADAFELKSTLIAHDWTLDCDIVFYRDNHTKMPVTTERPNRVRDTDRRKEPTDRQTDAQTDRPRGY